MNDILKLLEKYMNAYSIQYVPSGIDPLAIQLMVGRSLLKGWTNTQEQNALLEDLCIQFEVYTVAGRNFSRYRKEEVIDLYQRIASLFESHPDRKDRGLVSRQAQNRKRLTSLVRNKRLVDPYDLNRMIDDLEYLSTKNISVAELRENALSLLQFYKNMYNSMELFARNKYTRESSV